MILKGSDAVVPPPGGGVETVTAAVPIDATSPARMAARSCVLPTNVVARFAPFHFTIDAAVNPVPVTVNVNGPELEKAVAGESEPTTGVGFRVASTVSGALAARRPFACISRNS
jgi:hypothetical protein